MPSNTITLLRTAANNTDTNLPIVFFLHPVEGLVESLKPLASLLPYRAYGIECVESTPLDSITSLAEFYIKVRLISPFISAYLSLYFLLIRRFVENVVCPIKDRICFFVFYFIFFSFSFVESIF